MTWGPSALAHSMAEAVSLCEEPDGRTLYSCTVTIPAYVSEQELLYFAQDLAHRLEPEGSVWLVREVDLEFMHPYCHGLVLSNRWPQGLTNLWLQSGGGHSRFVRVKEQADWYSDEFHSNLVKVCGYALKGFEAAQTPTVSSGGLEGAWRLAVSSPPTSVAPKAIAPQTRSQVPQRRRQCGRCSKPFWATRRHAQWCSTRCRVAAHRERRRARQ